MKFCLISTSYFRLSTHFQPPPLLIALTSSVISGHETGQFWPVWQQKNYSVYVLHPLSSLVYHTICSPSADSDRSYWKSVPRHQQGRGGGLNGIQSPSISCNKKFISIDQCPSIEPAVTHVNGYLIFHCCTATSFLLSSSSWFSSVLRLMSTLNLVF